MRQLYCAIALREWLFFSSGGGGGGGSVGRRRSVASPVSRSSRLSSPASSPPPPSAAIVPDEYQLLARAHFELWQRLGLAAEPYHLHRARALFQQFLDETAGPTDAETLMQFCKVLQHCGDMEAAAQVVQAVLSLGELDPRYANYLFYAGCIFKALNQHERANAFFFDAAQAGPPRFFNKLEMMVLISRTIEELQALSGNADDDDGAGAGGEDDAYGIVHAHMVLEGHIDAALDCDDWVSDAQTWLSLADKCAAHEMFSLATDLYGLGITRDPEAFRRPRLWYRFAKACSRCGRANDAVLAIRQALTRAPHLKQLLQAETAWLALENASVQMATDPTRPPTPAAAQAAADESDELRAARDLAQLAGGAGSAGFVALTQGASLRPVLDALPPLVWWSDHHCDHIPSIILQNHQKTPRRHH